MPHDAVAAISFSDPMSAAASALAGTVPVVAFTVADVTPAVGAVVTVTNRSTVAATLDTGDGRPPLSLATGASAPAVYLDPGAFTMVVATGGVNPMTIGLPVVVSGVGQPSTLTYTGPAGAPVGAHVTLTAAVTSAGGIPIPNRAVRFTIAGRVLDAPTDTDGIVRAELVVDFAAASYGQAVDVPALPGGTGASTIVPFTVAANGAPMVDLRGPYDVLVNEAVVPDLSSTFDPDGFPLVAAAWDLDGDGAFDDLTGFGPIDAAVVKDVVCHGQCTPGIDHTITLRVVDKVGGIGEGSALVRFARDFSLSVAPGTAIVNPGGSISFQVGVLTSSGFADPVSLTAPGLPVGVTASFVPPAVTPAGTSILTLTAAADSGAFNTPFTVRGTSGAVTHDATSTVEVEFGLVPACLTTLTIDVQDGQTGAPVPGVTFSGTNVVSDANGRVVFADVPVGYNNAPQVKYYGIARDGATARGLRCPDLGGREDDTQEVRRADRPPRDRCAGPQRSQPLPRHRPQRLARGGGGRLVPR